MANRIWIELPQPSYFTGDVVSGTVALETEREVDARGLSLDILGREATVITRQQGKSSVTYRSHADIIAWRMPLHWPGIVPAGIQRFPIQFQVPVYGLPSHTGPHPSPSCRLPRHPPAPCWPGV